MPITAGLVLAAGEGRRFGGPKAPVVVDGERLVDRAVRILREAGCDPVVVVLGAWVGDVPGAVLVVNEDWPTGMGSSLRCGLEHLASVDADDGRHASGPRRAVDVVLVTLVDLPGLTTEAVRRIAAAAGDDPREVLAAATYDGVRGHPVLLGRSHWSGVAMSAVGDRGARTYLAEHDVIPVEVADVAQGDDLDEHPPTDPS
ncbi:MAG TPA: NTP transferase domain-containing protein [Candidatus Nanopelagicales bacterium]